ncbi:hypothetical protein CBL_10362 [Carabus blaptoides fortunei]
MELAKKDEHEPDRMPETVCIESQESNVRLSFRVHITHCRVSQREQSSFSSNASPAGTSLCPIDDRGMANKSRMPTAGWEDDDRIRSRRRPKGSTIQSIRDIDGSIGLSNYFQCIGMQQIFKNNLFIPNRDYIFENYRNDIVRKANGDSEVEKCCLSSNVAPDQYGATFLKR